MNETSTSISKGTVDRQPIPFAVAVLMFLSFFPPATYAVPTLITRLWQGLMVLSCFLALCLLLARGKMTIRWLSFCFFYISIFLFSSLVAGSQIDWMAAASYAVRCIGFVTLCEFLFQQNIRRAIAACAIALSTMCIIHLASVLLYFNTVGGMRSGYIEYSLGRSTLSTQNWYFLTYDNNSVVYFLPAIVLCWYYAFKFNNKVLLFAIPFSFASLLSYVSKNAATAEVSVGLLILTLFILLMTNYRSKPVLSLRYSNAVLLGAAFCAGIVALVGSGFVTEIAGIFGKTGGLTGRDTIWANSIAAIDDAILFGHGVEPAEVTNRIIGHNHCHNMFLQILYSGGILSALFFVLGVYSCRPKSCSHKSNTSFQAALVGIACFFIFAGIDWLSYYPAPIAIFYLIAFDSESKITDMGASPRKERR